MTGTIAERLASGAGRGFVGRTSELAELSAPVAATDPSFLVAFVHGPGGIGKSRLLEQLVAGVPAGTASVVLDGRDVEPTPRGFRQAMARALGLGTDDPGTADVVAALRGSGAGRTVLTVDTYETLGLLDGWLRTRFLPALPARS